MPYFLLSVVKCEIAEEISVSKGPPFETLKVMSRDRDPFLDKIVSQQQSDKTPRATNAAAAAAPVRATCALFAFATLTNQLSLDTLRAGWLAT